MPFLVESWIWATSDDLSVRWLENSKPSKRSQANSISLRCSWACFAQADKLQESRPLVPPLRQWHSRWRYHWWWRWYVSLAEHFAIWIKILLIFTKKMRRCRALRKSSLLAMVISSLSTLPLPQMASMPVKWLTMIFICIIIIYNNAAPSRKHSHLGRLWRGAIIISCNNSNSYYTNHFNANEFQNKSWHLLKYTSIQIKIIHCIIKAIDRVLITTESVYI